MRRIVTALLSTITILVLLFSYRTSTNSGGTAVAAVASAALPKTTTATTPTPSPTTTSGTGGGDDSGSSDDGGGTVTAPTPTPSTTTTAPKSGSRTSGTFTGDAVMTQWGVVQVQITVSNGKITAATPVQYPNGNGRDMEINSYALPVLNQEVISAQSANIDMVSGATVTSGGYLQSLQSAIDQAHL